jgi:hypothetical protein
MGEEKRCMTSKAVGWPTLSFLTRRHPEAAESSAKPRTLNEGSLHSASSTTNKGCPIFRALCERWETSNLATAVPLT